VSIHLYQGDLPDDLDLGPLVAVDTETQGLNLQRDRLCVVQLSSGDGVSHLVQFPDRNYDAPNLRRILSDPSVTKILQYARFDIGVIKRNMGITMAPVYCTKIASKLVRTYTDRHGLSALCRELLGVDLSKQQQSSDWAAAELSQDQLSYAAADVLYLHRLKEKLDIMLEREGRTDLARACCDFLPTRAELDLGGWQENDIFSHS
jgi:ribonuclease D